MSGGVLRLRHAPKLEVIQVKSAYPPGAIWESTPATAAPACAMRFLRDRAR